MSNVKKVAGSSTILFTGSIFNRIFEILSILLLTEFMDVGNFGYYRAIFAYFGLWALLIDLGVTAILIREGSRDRDRALDLLFNGYALGALVVGAVICASYYTMHYLVDYEQEVKNLFWYGLFSVIVSSRFKSYRKMFEALFIIDLKVVFPAVFNVLDRLLFMGSLLLFVRYSHSLQQAVLLTVLVDAFGFFLLLASHGRLFSLPRFRFDFGRWKYLIGESWPLAFSSFVNVINIRLSLLIITALLSGEAVGIYGFASLIPESLGFICPAIIVPTLPVLAQKFVRNQGVFFRFYYLLNKYLMFIVCPIVAYFFVELDEIMKLLVSLFLKEEYLLAVPVAQILIFSEIFIFSFTGFSQGLTLSDNQRYIPIMVVLSTIGTVVLNLLLIPRYGVNGAAYATVASFSLYIFTGLLIPRIRTFGVIIIRAFVKPGLAAAVAGVVCYLVDTNMWITLILGGIINIGVLYLLRGISREDYELLYEAFPTRIVRWLITREKDKEG